jgi:hypothetical protein
MTQNEWLQIGRNNQWITTSFDYYDGGPELSDSELELVEEGDLPEVWCFRFYEQKEATE